MNSLTLAFNTTFYNGWPRLKFYIDNDLYQEFVANSESSIIDIPIDLLDGSHELVVELWGKTQLNTLVKDGIIVKDQLVTLDRIQVDGVQLPDYFKYSGTFYHGSTSQCPCVTWGQNGQWRWNFTTPIITWVLVKIKEEEQKHFTKQQLGEDFGNEEWSFKEISDMLEKLNY